MKKSETGIQPVKFMLMHVKAINDPLQICTPQV